MNDTEAMVEFMYSTELINSGYAPRLPWRYIFTLLMDRQTPVRAVTDIAIRHYIRYLLSPGTIYELGSTSDYYKKFVPGEQKYIVTDFSPGASMTIDMTAMPFADNSCHAFFSAFSLEHVKEYRKAIAEIKRTLRPGGRIFLIVPFLYYYHAAPSDYVRFTSTYLAELFSDMRMILILPLGNRSLCISEFFHEKSFTDTGNKRIIRFLLRLLSVAFVVPYIIRPKNNKTFASSILLLAEKI